MKFDIDIDNKAVELTSDVFYHNSNNIWLTFRIEEDANIVADFVGQKDNKMTPRQEWERFLTCLYPDTPVYAVFKFPVQYGEYTRSKVVFIMWVPGIASVKQKLTTSMYCEQVKNSLSKKGGFPIFIQANDLSDLNYRTVYKKIQSQTSF